MKYAALMLIGITLIPSFAMGCGLDWTLPTNHFDGVEEHGYVSYWEKIGEADLGDGLVIPVNINFNSHRESSSPTLGKGWMVALLESHVEPIDENSMHVIMPDGWTFIFLRNGNAETWRGNAGWVGETNNTVFTITAPCGWRIKFDGGKIQEIDTPKNRSLSYKYNGPAATEVDIDNRPFVQVESDNKTGVAEDLLIGGQKIDIAFAQRPRVQTMLKQNLVTSFDPSLNQLKWPDGKMESFAFGTADKTLDPTLAITHSGQTERNFSWDATTRQIKIDGVWTYNLTTCDNVPVNRTNTQGQSESYSTSFGTITEQGTDGTRQITTTFSNAGPLSGKLRKIELIRHVGDKPDVITECAYDEKGRLVRETTNGIHYNVTWNDQTGGVVVESSKGALLISKSMYDKEGGLIRIKTTNVVEPLDSAAMTKYYIFNPNTKMMEIRQ